MQTGDITLTSNNIKVEKAKDADFLVGLSALSSTSNLVAASNKPLDIVLVLDESSSMGERITSYTYTPAYNPSTNWVNRNSYYALVDGRYIQIERISSGWGGFDHWSLNGEEVEPKTSEDDPNGVQFYTRRSNGSMTRMQALQSAANAFIDEAATENDGAPQSNQHRLAIVTYSDNATIENQLTFVDSQSATTLKRTVDGLRTNGNTYSNRALSEAQDALAGARDDAQKVVIFFTDGEPSRSGSNWDADLAAEAINVSKDMKDNKVAVYSVGMIEGADASDTSSNANKFLNAVSSNYPNATATYSGSGQHPQNKVAELSRHVSVFSKRFALSPISTYAARVSDSQ